MRALVSREGFHQLDCAPEVVKGSLDDVSGRNLASVTVPEFEGGENAFKTLLQTLNRLGYLVFPSPVALPQKLWGFFACGITNPLHFFGHDASDVPRTRADNVAKLVYRTSLDQFFRRRSLKSCQESQISPCAGDQLKFLAAQRKLCIHSRQSFSKVFLDKFAGLKVWPKKVDQRCSSFQSRRHG